VLGEEGPHIGKGEDARDGTVGRGFIGCGGWRHYSLELEYGSKSVRRHFVVLGGGVEGLLEGGVDVQGCTLLFSVVELRVY
jgi:hypothetical protein